MPVFIILVLLPFIWVVYLVITSVIGFLHKKKEFPKVPPKNRFLCVIPARNEETVIGELIDSLNKLDYPKELYDVVVILNNCTDGTKKVCQNLNVSFLEPQVLIRSKGDALNWFFNEMSDSFCADAYVVFDADNVVDHNFLKEVNAALEAGYSVCQGMRIAKNVNDNFLTGGYGVYYLLNNLMFQTRRKCGNSSPINGSGYVIGRNWIDKHGYHTHTLTEDIELAGICAIEGEQVAYIETAITYDEQPVKIGVSLRQLKRWSTGGIQCLRVYGYKLFRAFLHRKKQYPLDIFILYFTPLGYGLIALESIALTLLAVIGVEIAKTLFLIVGAALLITIFSSLAVACWGVFSLMSRQFRSYLRGILFFPVFMLIWFIASMASIFHKSEIWVETPHKRAISIDELQQ